jgi:hypothetical protein
MTPDDVSGLARQRYNAVGDSFFADTELYNLLWQAQQILAMQTKCIEDVQTTTTVIGQHEYAMPTNAISIKRVTYNGISLIPINFTEDDIVTGFSAATTSTGQPAYYYEWEESIYLRPTPNEALTLKVWFFARPQTVSSTSTLDIKEEYQLGLVDFLLQHMFGKDGKDNMSAYHMNLWNQFVINVGSWEAKRRRGNSAAAVLNLDALGNLSSIT